MLIYFKSAVFVILLCLTSWSTSTKATDNLSSEKEFLLSKPYLSTHKKEINNNNRLKQGEQIESEETRIFREKVDKIFKEFEGFESLPLHQQQQLLGRWKGHMIKDWVVEEKLAYFGMMDGQLVVSEETSQKLRRVYKLYLEEKKGCMIF